MIVLLMMGVLAFIAGLLGHVAATHHRIRLFEPFASRVPADRHVAFLTDLCAHLASYAGGFLGRIVLCVWVLISRARAHRAALAT